MPWKKNEKDVSVWVPPTSEDIGNFDEQLTDAVASKDELSGKVQAQMHTFMEKVLDGHALRANSNISMMKGMTALNQNPGSVDIVIPVYGGLQILKHCVRTVVSRTNWPFNVTLVDDASPDEATKEYLKDLESRVAPPFHRVITNKTNRGFAASVNRGIRAGTSPYVCVLNSDVLVTENWMTKMLMALHADPRNQIVNPMTNNTALINVEMQEGQDYQAMNRAFERMTAHKYPEISPTGFCFLFRRELFDELGGFDEAYGAGYGEESHFWMQAISHVQNKEYKRWKAVLADDTYLFHERGSSFGAFSEDAQMAHRKAGAARFHASWPSYKKWIANTNIDAVMKPLRQPLPESAFATDSSYNLCFVTFDTKYCGGMRMIADIVNEMNERGVNATVAHIKRSPDSDTEVLGELRSKPVVFNSPEEFVNTFATRVFDKGVLVAGTAESCSLVNMVSELNAGIKTSLYAQSDDMALANSPEQAKLMEDAIRKVDSVVSNSEWLDKKLNNLGIRTLGCVLPGYDGDLFFPRDRELGDERPTALFFLSTANYPFKGRDRGIETAVELHEIAKAKGKDIRIMAYGVQSIIDAPFISCMGPLSQPRIAQLLSTEVDVFCDPSTVHTYGLPALEAMASGVVPVSWDNKGINEYASAAEAKVVPAATSAKEMAKHMFDLLTDEPRLNNMRSNAAVRAKSQTRTPAVDQYINLLESKMELKSTPRRIVVITPHLRKWGGPTTIVDMANSLKDRGHDVSLHTVHTDIHPKVEQMCRVPIFVDHQDIPNCDVLITNSDNPYNEFFSNLPQAKKKILFKLSHNERFQAEETNSLNLEWDAIVTSTQWLADACEKPLEGWDHKPQKATRVGWSHYSHSTFEVPPNKRKFNKAEGTIVIGCLAHHHPLKGTNESLTALRTIKEKYGDNVHILALGEWPEFGKQKPNWVQYGYELDRTQMQGAFRQMDVWVSMSHTEGLGRMALEAMSCSVPVIMSDTGAEFAEPGHNCLLVPKGDIKVLTETVDKFLTDYDLRGTLATGAFETAQKYADPEEYQSNMARVIKGLFNG